MSTEATKTEIGSYFISNYPPYSQWNSESLPFDFWTRWPLRATSAAGTLPPHSILSETLQVLLFQSAHECQHLEEIERYVSALSREIELVSQQPAMGGRPIRFVYFGGGTPSYLSVKQLHSLFERLHRSITWDQAGEVTFGEPGTLSEPKVQAACELGVTRLSLGVENFSDAILEGMVVPICRKRSIEPGNGSVRQTFPTSISI